MNIWSVSEMNQQSHFDHLSLSSDCQQDDLTWEGRKTRGRKEGKKKGGKMGNREETDLAHGAR